MARKIKRTAQGQTVTIYTDGWPVTVYVENEINDTEIKIDGQEAAEGLLWALERALGDLKEKTP